VVVTGQNFPAGLAVMLRLGPPDVGATPFSYASGTADQNGSFTLTFTIPENWPDGRPITETELTVIVLNEEGSLRATAPFSLAPGMVIHPAAPPGDGLTTSDPALVAAEEAIVGAVTAYQTQTGASSQSAVSVELIEGEFARVVIHSLEADSEGPQTGFLKSVGGVWEVLIIGRDFDSEQLMELGIPTTLLPEEILTPEG
jgi:hypothetical protein